MNLGFTLTVLKQVNAVVVGYITIKTIGNYNSINSINLLCFIICEVDGYIEDKDGNKYLTFLYTDKNKEGLTKQTKLWDEIKYLIRHEWWCSR